MGKTQYRRMLTLATISGHWTSRFSIVSVLQRVQRNPRVHNCPYSHASHAASRPGHLHPPSTSGETALLRSQRITCNPWVPAGAAAAAATVRLCCAAARTSFADTASPLEPASPPAASESNWQEEVLKAAADSGQLLKMSLKGRISASMPYKMVNVRPVLIKGSRRLQFSHLDAKQDVTKNFTDAEAAEHLQQLMDLPWSSISITTMQQNIKVQFSKRGRATVQRSAAAAAPGFSGALLLQHDRRKDLPIDGGVADPFLQKIGLQTSDGRIKANMQAKFTQINEFLKLLIHTNQLDQIVAGASRQQQEQQQQDHTSSASEAPAAASINGTPSSSGSSSSSSGQGPIHILDCGCGSAHLTFGTYHYLHHVKGVPVVLSGIDTNAKLMERSNSYCQELGLRPEEAHFHTSTIRNFTPPTRPDIVLALHACDTATDEALALGVRSGAPLIMCVPCCHKDLHQQLLGVGQRKQGGKGAASVGGSASSSNGSSSSSAAGTLGSSSSGGRSVAAEAAGLLSPMLGHGIMRQRFVDLLTDTFRAQLLRIAGYRTDVVEFVSTEHTPRNLLIRAVKETASTSGSIGGSRSSSTDARTEGRDCAGIVSPAQAKLIEEYVALKEMWGVVPFLEGLLEDVLPPGVHV